MVGAKISHYRLLDKIGEGAMGVVYVAEDELLKRRVAIKMIARDALFRNYNLRTRLKREAQAISRLNHQHIATVYEYGETEDGHPFLVMELVEGRTLADLIKSKELSVELAVQIAKDVAEALDEAHRHGIIHRDIKPSNIALCKRNVVKVLDFGLAKQVQDADETEDEGSESQAMTQTREGVVLGTPLYLSPEQALGTAVDGRSDLFSLGCLLYECLTGEPPFSGQSSIEICAKIIRDEPLPPSQINRNITPELDRLVLKALAKSPENRFQSAEEFINALNESGQQTGNTAEQQRKTGRSRSFPLTTKEISQIIRAPFKTGSYRQSSRSLYLIPVLVLIIGFLGWSAGNRFYGNRNQASPLVKSLYDEGRQAMLDGDYFKAQLKLREAVQSNPHFAMARLRLAEALRELDYGDDAAKEIAEIENSAISLESLEKIRLRAVRLTNSNDFYAAVAAYRELERLSPENEKAQFLYDLARAYERNEEIDKAIESLQKATQQSPPIPAVHLRLGVLYGRKQNVANATESFEKAKAIYQSLQNLTGLAAVYCEHGSLFAGNEQAIEARVKLQQAFDAAQAADSLHYKIRALLELSRVAVIENNDAESKRYALDALDLARGGDLKSLTTQLLNVLGNNALSQRKHDEAEYYFLETLKSAESHNSLSYAAAARASLASLYEQQDKPNDALAYLEPALNFYRTGKYSRQYSNSLLLYGRIMIQKGNFAQANEVFNEAVEHAAKSDNIAQVAKAHLEVGSFQADSELLPEALRHFEQSCSLFAKVNNQLMLAYCLSYRSQTQWRLGRYQEAEATLEQMSKTIQLLDQKYKQTLGLRIKLIQAQIALSRLNYNTAIGLGREVLKSAGTPHSETEASYLLGMALAYSGSKTEGRKLCDKAVKLSEKTNDLNLRNSALLALAETELITGNANKALDIIEQSEEQMKRQAVGEMRWRACLLASRAAQILGDEVKAQNYAAISKTLLTKLEERWSTAILRGYLLRPDNDNLRKISNLTQVAGY